MYKKRGSILATAMVAVICWIFIAQSFFITTSSQFKTIKSSRVALQAQQYAEISIDRLKACDYENLDANGAHARATITGLSSADWEDEVTIGSESTIPGSDDAKQRIATINVYKKGDSLPRYSVELPLSSQSAGSCSSGESIGTIVARLSANFTSSKEAECYLYCDGSSFSIAAYPELYAILGTNTLPDIRDRFLEGSEVPSTVIEAGLPDIYGSFGIWGSLTLANGAFYPGPSGTPAHGTAWNYNEKHAYSFSASRCSSVYGKSTTVQPASITVRYYIRAK